MNHGAVAQISPVVSHVRRGSWVHQVTQSPPLHHANTICHTSSEQGPLSHTYCIIVSAEQAEEGIDISIIIDKSMPGKRNERQIS